MKIIVNLSFLCKLKENKKFGKDKKNAKCLAHIWRPYFRFPLIYIVESKNKKTELHKYLGIV